MNKIIQMILKTFAVPVLLPFCIIVLLLSAGSVHSGLLAGTTTENISFELYQKEDPDGLVEQQEQSDDKGIKGFMIKTWRALTGIGKKVFYSSILNYYNNLDAETLLKKMKDGTIKLTSTQETMMKISNENFMYMLEKIVEYEKSGLAYREVTVEARNVGSIAMGANTSNLFSPFLLTANAAPEDESGPGVGLPEADGGSSSEDAGGPTYEDIVVQVSNADYEGLSSIDWRIFYAYCILANVGMKDFGDVSEGSNLIYGGIGNNGTGSLGSDSGDVLTVGTDVIWTGWSYYESGNLGYEAAATDNGHAYGRYQLDIGYDFEEFMKFCVEQNSEHYNGFNQYIMISDPKPGRYKNPSATTPYTNSSSDNKPLLDAHKELSELWVSYCNRYKEEFYNLQTVFVYNRYYKKAEASMKRVYGIDISNRGPTLKGTVWSIAVRDGYAASKDNAKNNLRAITGTYTEGISDYEWLKKIYPAEAERHPSQENRWNNQQYEAAMNFMKNENNASVGGTDENSTTGSWSTGYNTPDKQKYGLYISKYTINGVMEELKMKYSYEYNVMTDPKTYYSYDEGESGGNRFKHINTGEMDYYLPVSVFNKGESGISRIELLVENGQSVGIRKIFEKEKFDAFGKEMYRGYSFSYMQNLIRYAPGGERCIEQIMGWLAEATSGGLVVMSEARFGDITPENYYTGSANNDIYYGKPGIYDGSLGSAAAEMAIGLYNTHKCVYTQSSNRDTKPYNYDCSSFVYRIYKYLGINIGATNTAGLMERANEGRAYYRGNSFPAEQAQPGDIAIRRSNGSGHTGIYVGNGMMVHASFCYWTNSINANGAVVGPKDGSRDIRMDSVADFIGNHQYTWFRPYENRDISGFVPGETYVSPEGVTVKTE